MPNKKISTTSAPAPRGFYSQGVRNGNLVFVSGQLPLDASGNLVSGGIAEHAQQTLKNVQAILEAAGGTIDDLAQVTVYITDLAHWAGVKAVYQKVLWGGEGAPPPGVRPTDGPNKGGPGG